ncbi:conjugal transfer protein TraX [Paenibacillus pasadenensis]|uniref:TraX family protein n=1 Tax=Paenibacillus pasadenensis TaxID=217090 RepID=UPI00203DC396|nr:TraX family protein [Paenibacillus pasadenensis]MCM3750226.1 conjugal transfer protein TraX [Paenibacillus pasadenensis]
MQLLAIVTMLLDHVGLMFFPDSTGWRVVGRISFPIYAYLITVGYRMTSSRPKYLLRLAGLALLSQLPYMLAFNTTGYNAIFSLLASALVLYAVDGLLTSRLPRLAAWTMILPIVLAAAAVMTELPFDYNAYGLLLILLYRYSRGLWTVLLHLLLNVFYLIVKGPEWGIQMFSIVSTLLLVYGAEVRAELDKLRVPRWLWRAFYPAHLAVLAVLYVWIEG